MRVHWPEENDDPIREVVQKFAIDHLNQVLEALTIARFHKSTECLSDEECDEISQQGKDVTMEVVCKAVEEVQKANGGEASGPQQMAAIAEAIHEACLEIIRKGKVAT